MAQEAEQASALSEEERVKKIESLKDELTKILQIACPESKIVIEEPNSNNTSQNTSAPVRQKLKPGRKPKKSLDAPPKPLVPSDSNGIEQQQQIQEEETEQSEVNESPKPRRRRTTKPKNDDTLALLSLQKVVNGTSTEPVDFDLDPSLLGEINSSTIAQNSPSVQQIPSYSQSAVPAESSQNNLLANTGSTIKQNNEQEQQVQKRPPGRPKLNKDKQTPQPKKRQSKKLDKSMSGDVIESLKPQKSRGRKKKDQEAATSDEPKTSAKKGRKPKNVSNTENPSEVKQRKKPGRKPRAQLSLNQTTPVVPHDNSMITDSSINALSESLPAFPAQKNTTKRKRLTESEKLMDEQNPSFKRKPGRPSKTSKTQGNFFQFDILQTDSLTKKQIINSIYPQIILYKIDTQNANASTSSQLI